MKLLFKICAIMGMTLLPLQANALVTGADTAGGYAAKVLETVLRNYIMPAGATGSATVLVRITADGRPYSCELRSASPMPQVDDAICQAVAASLQFPAPPSGMTTGAEVALTFIYDNTLSLNQGSIPNIATPPKELTYAEVIMANAKPLLIMPSNIDHGDYSTVVKLRVASNGSILEYKVEKPSGNVDLDNLVMRTLLTPNIVPTPKSGIEESVTLTFSMKL